MSHVAAMLTNLLSNRKQLNVLQSCKIHGEPDECHSDNQGHFESAAEQWSSGADDWKQGSRSGTSTSSCLDFEQDIAAQGEEECDERRFENAIIRRTAPLCSVSESRQDDELSGVEYEDSDYHDYNSDNFDVETLDENTYTESSEVSPSKHCAGSGYYEGEDQYPDNPDGIFYRNEKFPKSPSHTVSTDSTYLHCRERDKRLSAHMVESKIRSTRKASVNKAPFYNKPLQNPKHSCMEDAVLLSSRPCYGSPVHYVTSASTIGRHHGPIPKFRHIPGSSKIFGNSDVTIFTRASLTLPRRKISRLVCDDVPFQSSHIYSSGQFGFLSKGGVTVRDVGDLDNKYALRSKLQDSLRKEVHDL